MISLYWRAQIIFICLSALVGGSLWVKKPVHDSRSTPVEASVTTIDRLCDWKDKGTGEVRRLPCTHDDVAGGLTKDDRGLHYVEGEAVIHFVYAAPQDGIERPGELTISGKDPRVHDLKAGETLAIRVAKDDPERFETR